MDPISIKLFMGAGGAAPVLTGFEITDSNKLSSYIGAWFQADSSGNVYGTTNDNYFKVSAGGSLLWQYGKPSFYGSSPIQNMAVSQNGSYFVVVGQGGPAGYGPSGSRAGITKIDPSTGTAIKTFESEAANHPSAYRIASMSDVAVNDSGICNAVGNHYRIFNAPYNEFLRMAVNLSTDTIVANHGRTNGTYPEVWQDVDMAGSYCAMGGGDGQRPQAAFQQYNWSLFAEQSTFVYFSKSYQSNAGNGVYGNGVAVNASNGYVYSGYGDAGGTRGIAVHQSNGSIIAYRSIYYSVPGDLSINKVATDGTYIYFLGQSYAIVSGQLLPIVGCILASNGAFQWANYFTHSAATIIGSLKMRYNAGTNALDLSIGTNASNGKAAYFSLPVDGSGEGTYGGYTYTPVTLQKADASVSWYTASPSFSSWSSYTNNNTSSSSSNLSVVSF